MELEEGQVVMCTVDKIIGTAVFVKIEGNGEGTIVTSEVAPGRIRNLRDYVSPGRKIVCKVLKIDKTGNIHLSLRRVIAKEKKLVLELYEREKNLAVILKTITKDAEKIIEKIKQKENLTEFFEKAKQEPKLLEKFLNKEEREKILGILKTKKEKQVFVKKEFRLYSESSDGILRIKKILPPDVLYIAAGRFSIEIKNADYKNANHKLNALFQEIEQKAKQENCKFEIIERK